MSTYIPKYTEIEAEQFTDDHCPAGILYRSGRCFVTTINGNDARVFIGDWIVAEPDGVHHYPIKPEIFEKRWQPKADVILDEGAGYTGDPLVASATHTPLRLAAYAILDTGELIGFLSVEDVKKWEAGHSEWRELGWNDPMFNEWRRKFNEALREP